MSRGMPKQLTDSRKHHFMARKKKGRIAAVPPAVAGNARAAEPDRGAPAFADVRRLSDWQGLLIRVLLALWMPAVILALWPYVNNPATPIKMLLTALTAAAVAVLVWARGPLPRSGLLVGFVLWLLWHGWTALHAMDPVYALRSAAPVACWIVLGVGAMAAVSRAGQAWNLLCIWILALACSALYAVAQRYGLDPFPWATRSVEEYRALPATFGNPNYAAHALITGIVAAVALIARRPTRWFALLCALPMLWHLWATSMRAAAIALMATAAAWTLWTVTAAFPPRRRITAALASAACAVLAGFLLLSLSHEAFTAALTRRIARQDSLTLRINGWQGAAQLISERPLNGHGPGMYICHAPSRWQEYEKRWYARTNQRNAHVHNEYLEFGVELGLPGLLLHLWLLLRHVAVALCLAAWHPSADTRRFGRFAALAALAMAADGLFGFNLHLPVTGGFFYVLLGMTEGVRLGARQKLSAGTGDVRAAVSASPDPAAISVPLWRRIPRLAWPALAATALQICWSDYRCDGVLLRTRAIVERMQKNPNVPQNLQDQLEKNLRQAMVRYPWESTFPQRLGWLLLQQKRFPEADTALAEAIRLEPWTVRLWTLRAQAMNGWAARTVNREQNLPAGMAMAHRAGLYGQFAEQLCEPFASVHDSQWRTALFFLVLGQNDTRISPYLQTLRDFFALHTEKALAYGSRDPAAVLTTLAEQLATGNEHDRGVHRLAASLELDPKSAETWRIVSAYSESGHGGPLADAMLRGRAILRHALPENRDLFLTANEACIRFFSGDGNDPVLAQALYQDGAQALPDRLEAWAQVQYLTEAPDEKLRLITAAARRLTRTHPAVAGLVAGDAEALFQVLEQPSGSDGQTDWLLPLAAPLARSPGQRLALGRALVLAGNPQQAEAILAVAAPSDTEPAGLRGGLLAWRAAALAGLGRQTQALPYALQATELIPGDGEVQWILARCLRDSGRIEEALAAYKKALAALPQSSALFNTASREFGELSRRRRGGNGIPQGDRP